MRKGGAGLATHEPGIETGGRERDEFGVATAFEHVVASFGTDCTRHGAGWEWWEWWERSGDVVWCTEQFALVDGFGGFETG